MVPLEGTSPDAVRGTVLGTITTITILIMLCVCNI